MDLEKAPIQKIETKQATIDGDKIVAPQLLLLFMRLLQVFSQLFVDKKNLSFKLFFSDLSIRNEMNYRNETPSKAMSAKKSAQPVH